MENKTTTFWMNKIEEDIRMRERKRIQENIRQYCNNTKQEFITYPEVLKIISKINSHTP